MTRAAHPEPAAHPERNALLSVQLGEAEEAERRTVEAHLGDCVECRAYVSLLADTVAALGGWTDEEPPADGLARVLAVVGPGQRVARRREEWLRPVLLSLAGVLAGSLLIYLGGVQLALRPTAQAVLLGPMAALSAFGLAALVFFGAGSLVTLALAPMLILERQENT